MTFIETICSGVETWQAVTFAVSVVLGGITWCTAIYLKACRLITSVAETEKKVAEITALVKKELNWNGSTSMKDNLDSLVASFSKMDAWSTALQNQSHLAMWRADAVGDLDWVNSAFTQATGVGLENLKGSMWLDLVCEEDRERVEHTWLRCLERYAPFTITFSLSPGDENCDNVLMQAQPFFAPQKQGGKLLGFAGTLQVVGSGK